MARKSLSATALARFSRRKAGTAVPTTPLKALPPEEAPRPAPGARPRVPPDAATGPEVFPQAPPEAAPGPEALLAAARTCQGLGDWQGVADALTAFLALDSRALRLGPPGAAPAEPWVLRLLAEALWRLRRRREAILWACRSADLALASGRYQEAFAGLRIALHACFLEGEAEEAARCLERMASILPHLGGSGGQPAAELAADQAWSLLLAGRYPEAVGRARAALDHPAAGLQVRAQILWVLAETALRVGARAAAIPLRTAAHALAVQAGWDLGLRLCADLAARLASSQGHRAGPRGEARSPVRPPGHHPG